MWHWYHLWLKGKLLWSFLSTQCNNLTYSPPPACFRGSCEKVDPWQHLFVDQMNYLHCCVSVCVHLGGRQLRTNKGWRVGEGNHTGSHVRCVCVYICVCVHVRRYVCIHAPPNLGQSDGKYMNFPGSEKKKGSSA